MFDDEAQIGLEHWIGAALEIGTDQIWAGQRKFEVINRTQVNMVRKTNSYKFESLFII